MKKTFFTILFLGLSVYSSQAQFLLDKLDPSGASGGALRNKYSNAKKEGIEGSPYPHPNFSLANIEGIPNNIMMRYNGGKDELEYIIENEGKRDTLVLRKVDPLKTVVFKNNTTYKYLPYVDHKGVATEGYLILVNEKNNVGLYKKESISLLPARKASNSYQASTPAKYARTEDRYFLKTENGTSPFPDSKKKLLALYPDKKSAIETYLKENKISFSKESDLIKLTAFIATM
ncbi:hypothetical protein [Flavobacterium kingsejongi]|uniref:Uncharacterized protein n=1 Tax=Flavobacterium kingsejongi TaxID=1678728 RepID=A0A2S1LJT4_9FLAO|nr:hypothetical protein [Flavobacterium kingsejongi]AWG24008.1 hypothetical protein FK004_01625 [Flavobacterium kingsejongi]